MCKCAFETKCKYDAFGTQTRKKKVLLREREVVFSKNGWEEKGKKYWSGERLLSKWVI